MFRLRSGLTIFNQLEGYKGTWVVESVSHELGAKQIFTIKLTATLEEHNNEYCEYQELSPRYG